MIITILVFLLILSILVLIHEGGHYFMAKKMGIKVEEFGFGFPPRLFGIKKGETIYSINWLPIGGFVKLYGEDEAGGGKVSLPTENKELRTKNKKGFDILSSKLEVVDRQRAFFAKTAWQRAAVIVAGVVMNAVLAAVIFYIFLGLSGFKTSLPLLSDYKFFAAKQINIQETVLSSIAKNSPAEESGLKALTKIVAVNDRKITSVNEFIKIIGENKGKEIQISWSSLENNQIHKTKITPRLNPPKGEGSLGVGLFAMSSAEINYETPVQKIFSGVTYPVNLMAYNLSVMGQLVKTSVEKKSAEPLSEGVSGPIGIASVTGSILGLENMKDRVLGLLNLAGILSISLAFFNILPLPALDGGRLFFILVEAVTGKKINVKIEGMIHSIGMIVLLALMALITFKDIGKLFIK